jgi:conjugative relaxase-like TrwC/TraI family protein
VGAGCADLGLVAGAEITAEVAQKTWTDLLHPATGQPLGRRKFHFAGPGERLAKVAHDRGIELPAGLDPKAVRKAVMRGEISDYTVSRRVAKHLRAEVSTEDLNDMRAEARTKAKEPCAYWDVTINASKDISLLQVALEAANQHERAALIEAALLKAAKAELAFLSEKVGSRMGTNGVKFVDAPNLAAVLYVHHFNRDGEPHLHVHMAVLNRVLCEDGTFRALDGEALLEAMPQAAAVGQRVLDEEIARSLGVRHHYDPKRKAQIIDGITDEMMDLYSGRRAVIKSEEKRWVKEFEERNGRAPTGRERRAARQHFSYRTRKAKSGEAELRASAVSRWVKGMADKIGKTHEDVLKAVFPAERRTVADFLRLRRKDAEAAERATYDRKAIAAAALKEVAAARSHDGHWSPFHMAMEVDRALPGDLGLRPEDVEALQTSIAEEALEAPELTCLSADDPVADAPAEFRRASDGKSVLTKRERRRYALTETLEKERRLLALPLRCGGAAMAADVAAAEVAARTQVVDPADPSKVIRPGLKPDQATIVEGVLASRRAVDLLVGSAGAGKSRLVATLPDLWPGQVFGLATSNAAAHVLEGEGLKRSRNIELWFRIQERLAAGLPKGGDEAFRLKKGCLIVVDEGSMVGTTDLLRICDLVSAAGGKVLITGDHHQLGAIKERGRSARS